MYRKNLKKIESLSLEVSEETSLFANYGRCGRDDSDSIALSESEYKKRLVRVTCKVDVILEFSLFNRFGD